MSTEMYRHAMTTSFIIFFFIAPATTIIYTLSLHDALPIYRQSHSRQSWNCRRVWGYQRSRSFECRALPARALTQFECRCSRRYSRVFARRHGGRQERSEEHTSELQSRFDLVCRLLLEKKKK